MKKKDPRPRKSKKRLKKSMKELINKLYPEKDLPTGFGGKGYFTP